MSSTNLDLAEDDPLIGSRIEGRYTVFGVLGQGGMGVVYDGVHDELGRPVAIKVLNAAWASDRTAVERFLREARTASSFSHGNIVDVSDLGRLSDGRPYLVMPKIAGVDLATLLTDNGPQPAKRVAALLTGVAAALDLVHAKGYVHRDIKPENLMYVVREDGSETVMLLDFGIAAAMMTSGPRLTRQGAIFGTPQYLPPEVCTGGRPDARGDVYALAGVAFELITGTLLFPIDDIMQLLAVKVAQPAPTLASATQTPFPPELEAVIARGLTRNPDDRYSSAGSFVRALREATEYAPVSWRTGVLRPAAHSAEHQLPPTSGDQQSWHGAGPTGWPSQHPQYSSGYGQDGQHGQHGQDPQRSMQTANPGAWGMQARSGSNMHPSDHYRQTDARLRMMDDEPSYRSSSHPRPRTRQRTERVARPVGMYVMLAAGAAVALLGGYQYWDSDRAAVTDMRAAESRPVPSTPAQPVQPPPAAAAMPARPARPRAAAAQKAPEGQDEHVAEAVPGVPGVQGVPSVQGVQGVQGAQPAASEGDLAALQPSGTGDTGQLAEATGAPELQPAAPAAVIADGTAPLAAAAPSKAPTKPRATAAANSGNVKAPARHAQEWTADAPPEPGAVALEAAAPVVVLTETPAAAQPSEPTPAAQAPSEPQAQGPSDNEQAIALTRKASEALLRGEVSRAVDNARKATTTDPSYALSWRTLGLALERSGTSAAAVSAYEEYLRRAPSGPQAEMVRQRMQSLSQ